MALEDYQAAVNDFKASLEQVQIDGSQAEERSLKQELRSAEIALKRSKTKDYYKILGLSVTACQCFVLTAGWKAYRRTVLSTILRKHIGSKAYCTIQIRYLYVGGENPLLTVQPYRVETKRSSSLLRKPTTYFQIHRSAHGKFPWLIL